jgi:hypothetical protein
MRKNENLCTLAKPTQKYAPFPKYGQKKGHAYFVIRPIHCLKNGPNFTFYTAEATNAILYRA